MFLISFFVDFPPTNREGKITPKPIEAILAITPKVVTRGEIIGLNQVLANFDGELIIKILPAAARKEPINTGTRLELINTLIQEPAANKIIPMVHCIIKKILLSSAQTYQESNLQQMPILDG
jgi:hypothetical protein